MLLHGGLRKVSCRTGSCEYLGLLLRILHHKVIDVLGDIFVILLNLLGQGSVFLSFFLPRALGRLCEATLTLSLVEVGGSTDASGVGSSTSDGACNPGLLHRPCDLNLLLLLLDRFHWDEGRKWCITTYPNSRLHGAKGATRHWRHVKLECWRADWHKQLFLVYSDCLGT